MHIIILIMWIMFFCDCYKSSQSPIKSNQIKSNHFYCHITTAQVPWWVKFLRACSRQFTYGQYIFTDLWSPCLIIHIFIQSHLKMINVSTQIWNMHICLKLRTTCTLQEPLSHSSRIMPHAYHSSLVSVWEWEIVSSESYFASRHFKYSQEFTGDR